MATSPMLIVHIFGGTLALLSGTAAMSFRKGSRWHRMAGNVFVFSMIIMGTAASYIAALKHDSGNITAGLLTFYLMLTAWLSARRGDGETSKFDWVLLFIPLMLGSLTVL